MRFVFLEQDPGRPVLSVDGVAEAGPNLSHWPGNRTPPDLRHDLSTGMVLRLLDASAERRRAFLAGHEVVVNTHFDTDGVLSVRGILAPDEARRHRELYLEAAAAGDFQVFSSERGLALDLALTRLGEGAPTGPGRGQWQYERCLERLPELLEDEEARRALAGEDLPRILEDLAELTTGAVRVRSHEAHSFAVVWTRRELDRVAIHAAAGAATRVLNVVPAGDGHLFRHHDRVESWFELATRRPPRRVPLDGVAAALQEQETAAGRWIAQPLGAPVPELFFGEEGHGRSFGPLRSGALAPSSLAPEAVEAALLRAFEAARVTRDPESP